MDNWCGIEVQLRTNLTFLHSEDCNMMYLLLLLVLSFHYSICVSIQQSNCVMLFLTQFFLLVSFIDMSHNCKHLQLLIIQLLSVITCAYASPAPLGPMCSFSHIIQHTPVVVVSPIAPTKRISLFYLPKLLQLVSL